MRQVVRQAGWTRVFVADHPIQASTLGGALEAAGLDVQVRGIELWSVAVEFLFTEGAAPAVWVPDEQADQAWRLIEELQQQANTVDEPSWLCEQCAESVPGGFGQCWQCGAMAPDSSDAARADSD